MNSKQIFYKAYCTVLYSRLFLCVKMLGFANVIRLCLYGFELYHTHSNAIMQIIKII